MLRFHRFTIGWGWTSDYGSSDDPEQFRTLLRTAGSGSKWPASAVDARRRGGSGDGGKVEPMATIPDSVREFLATAPLAHVVTMRRSGIPHAQVTWAGLDGDDLVFASFFDAQRAERVRRNPRVVVSFHAHEYDGPALYPYLVIGGEATATEGGALEVMDRLSQVYIGPGAEYPMRVAPQGWVFRVTIDEIYGQGPWNPRWVEADRQTR